MVDVACVEWHAHTWTARQRPWSWTLLGSSLSLLAPWTLAQYSSPSTCREPSFALGHFYVGNYAPSEICSAVPRISSRSVQIASQLSPFCEDFVVFLFLLNAELSTAKCYGAVLFLGSTRLSCSRMRGGIWALNHWRHLLSLSTLQTLDLSSSGMALDRLSYLEARWQGPRVFF